MAVEQTRAVFAPLKTRISDAVAKLEDQLAAGEEGGAPEAEVEAAKAALADAKKA